MCASKVHGACAVCSDTEKAQVPGLLGVDKGLGENLVWNFWNIILPVSRYVGTVLFVVIISLPFPVISTCTAGNVPCRY